MSPQLNFKIIGQGEPVIILHGLFGMLDNLQSIAKKLEVEGYMSFLIDQRDHGRSEHTNAFNYGLLANDLNSFLEENWIYKTILIGHSMGGKTGLKFISEYESLISKIIIIDMGVKAYDQGHNVVFDALLSIDLELINSREQVQSLLLDKLKDLGTVQFLMKNLSRKKTGGFEWKMNLPLLYKEYKNILEEIVYDRSIDIDILFIRGEKSDYILDKDILDLKTIFPNSKFVTIPDAGHWVHVDKPDELFKEIITFIKE